MSPALTITPPAAPTVSVLMLTHGALDWTRRAIGALVENTPPFYELIVVDNDSRDGTAGFLHDEVSGARVHHAGRNLGFGVGNDLAASYARGEFLCLLNSDALVPPGWLPPLLAPFAGDATVGAVVPVFVYPDGTLQEAGSVVEEDGRVVAYGARGDADDPEYHFAREVPYASAACLVLRRSTFVRLGGFDPGFGVGYYEDVDFAFELAAAGLRVVLEPSVRVVHAQGASSPTHEEAVARRDANQARFGDRWAHVLAGRPVVFGAHQAHRRVAARDVGACDRVLVLGDRVPEPGTGPLAATVEALRARLRDGRVTLAVIDGIDGIDAAVFGPDGPAPAVGEWLASGVEVVAVRDAEAWLGARRFHYSAVLAAPGVTARLGPALRDTQPQATITDFPAPAVLAAPAALDAWLLDLGLTPNPLFVQKSRP